MASTSLINKYKFLQLLLLSRRSDCTGEEFRYSTVLHARQERLWQFLAMCLDLTFCQPIKNGVSITKSPVFYIADLISIMVMRLFSCIIPETSWIEILQF